MTEPYVDSAIELALSETARQRRSAEPIASTPPEDDADPTDD